MPRAFPLLVGLFLVACAADPRVETVSFPTADGGTVFADVYGSGDHGLVLAHGGRFTKESWAAQAPVFAEAGFRVVALDFRGRGRSTAGSAGPDGVQHDVFAAIRWLRETGATRVAAIGASFGGSATARALVEHPGALERVVFLANPVDEPERLTGRKLFLLARDDFRGEGVPRLPEIREDYERAPEPKELVLVDGSAHAQFLFDTDQGERVLAELLRFLTAP